MRAVTVRRARPGGEGAGSRVRRGAAAGGWRSPRLGCAAPAAQARGAQCASTSLYLGYQTVVPLAEPEPEPEPVLPVPLSSLDPGFWVLFARVPKTALEHYAPAPGHQPHMYIQ